MWYNLGNKFIRRDKMRIDLPSCDFANCKYFSDYNCMNSHKRNKCYYKENRDIDNKLKDMKEFLQYRDGWSLKELIIDMSEETKLLKCDSFKGDLSMALDECSIIWGSLNDKSDLLCGLDDFIERYTEIFINNICNLIISYENTNQ